MYFVSSNVDSYSNCYIFRLYKDKIYFYDLENSNISSIGICNNNLNGTDIGSITGYKYYDQDSIKNDLDIDGIDYDFIINLDTRTVILLDGIQRDEKIYYSLCEIEGEQYNVDYVE